MLTINPDDPPGEMRAAASAATPSNHGTGTIPLAALGVSLSGGSTQGDGNLVQLAIVLGRGQQAIGNNPSAPAFASGASTVAANQEILDQLFSAGSVGNKGGKSGLLTAIELNAPGAQTVDELFFDLAQGS